LLVIAILFIIWAAAANLLVLLRVLILWKDNKVDISLKKSGIEFDRSARLCDYFFLLRMLSECASTSR
jgi:hypothetical protein